MLVGDVVVDVVGDVVVDVVGGLVVVVMLWARWWCG